MKFKISLVIGLISVLNFAQSTNEKDIDLSKIFVEYVNTVNKDISKEVAFIINGQKFPATIMRTINPEAIKNISVLKESILYPNGAVEVEIDNKKPIKIVSLQELLQKEAKLKENTNIYYIDDELIEAKSAAYFVDQNNIFRIVIKPIHSSDMNYNLIKIYTKSDQNIADFKNPKTMIQ